MKTNELGSQAIQLGGVLGGNVVGTIITNKIKTLDSNLGRIGLLLVGLVGATKSKSEILKAISLGVAMSGASGFVQQLVKGVAGIEGLMGVDGDYGVGDIIQGPDGMMYMVNGLGELEPVDVETLEGDEELVYLEGDDDHYLEGDDEVAALASVDDRVAAFA